MPKFTTSNAVKPLTEEATTPRVLAQWEVRRLTQISLAKQATQGIFGNEIAQVNEETLLFLEEQIPELAACALTKSYCHALASGANVLEAVDGALVETAPDGNRQFIRALPQPYQVKLGSKRFRQAD